MTRDVPRIYLMLLAGVVVGWVALRQQDAAQAVGEAALPPVLGACALYLCSHLFRMLRLTLLTLDDRHRALPLISAHALTAFPSSLLPFKIGEVLRLASFYHVYGYRQKALAVWLIERFGDLIVLAVLIVGLTLLQRDAADIPLEVLSLVVLGLSLGLLCLFALSKILHYLNRHLVLTGHRRRDLALLRLSDFIFRLELDIQRSITGRWAGFLLLSAFVWATEILAFAKFLEVARHQGAHPAAMFSDAFFTGMSLSGSQFAHVFEIYRSGALIAGTLVMMLILLIFVRKRASGS